MNKLLRKVLVSMFLLGCALQGRAQWITQTINLEQGWNAVYIHVDASHVTLDQMVGPLAPVLTPIEQIWRWTPNESMAQFIESPQQPVDTGSQWASWRRIDGGLSTLSLLTANSAYLVYSTAPYVWQIQGKPILPQYQWATSGLNFIGFPTVSAGPPAFEDFLAEAPMMQLAEIFRYTGGEFGPTNPGKLFALRTTPVVRGTAYWMRSSQGYNHYYGPFAVISSGGKQIEFGEDLSSAGFRLRNLTAEPLTVALTLRESETEPVGQPEVVAVPPLLVRGPLNPVNLTHSLSELILDTPHSWTLAPYGESGSEVEVVLGLDRASITQVPGELLAGVLELTDSLGHTRVDVGVSARPASQAGLWVGGAAINEVSQYLKSYLRGADNALVIQENGAYVVTEVVTNLTSVPHAFPLRLIVHNPNSGAAKIMQRVYYGFNAATNPVVATRQSALDSRFLAEARRISASHLPWSETNAVWSFNGPLAQGAVVQATVVTPYDDQASNPFLHTYHPDHDNLDPRFQNQVPQGSESFRIEREITLQVLPPENDFTSRVSAGLTLSGMYLETIRVVGLAQGGNSFDTRRFDVRGGFSLQRVANVPTLTMAP